jgi:hypothetical protein
MLSVLALGRVQAVPAEGLQRSSLRTLVLGLFTCKLEV